MVKLALLAVSLLLVTGLVVGISPRNDSTLSPSPSTITTTTHSMSTRESTNLTSKAITSTSESTASTSENITSTSKATISTSEDITSTSEATISTSEDITSTSESTTLTSEDITSTSKATISTSEDITSTSEDIISTSEDITSTSEATILTSEDITSTSEATVSTSEDITSTSEATISTSEDITLTSEATISTSEDITSTSEDITSTSEDITSTSEATTSTSETITSTSEAITSTTEPITSTTMNSTSTAMSSTPPITPTPFPEEPYNYNVTEKDTICIMFNGFINFAINYTVISSVKNKTEYAIANVNITERPRQDYIVTGNCSRNDQYLKIQWGLKGHNSSVTLTFSSNNKKWSLKTVNASIFMDPQLFKNASDANKTLEIVADFTFDPSPVAVNKSYTCDASLTTNNVNGTINGYKYNNTLTSKMENIQLQAYNLIANKTGFVDATSCPHVYSTVPIIIGCCLGGTVIVVLIAYIIGKRRKNKSNESTA